jgi:hypothetical protein
LEFIDQYEKETGLPGTDLGDVAWWAWRKNLWEPPDTHPVRMLQSHLARACQRESVTNERGERVRKRYAVKDEKSRQMQWITIDKATPQQIRISSQDARNGALGIVLQIDRNLEHFNKKYSPGDAITMSFNFDLDVAEQHMPDEYPDSAPPEDQSAEE